MNFNANSAPDTIRQAIIQVDADILHEQLKLDALRRQTNGKPNASHDPEPAGCLGEMKRMIDMYSAKKLAQATEEHLRTLLWRTAWTRLAPTSPK